MSFDLANYRISLEGLRILMVELAEIHDHIRDLCSEPPSQLHRSQLVSFGGDLSRVHHRAEISLAVIRAQLREDKKSISALAKTYRQDHYTYGKSKPAPPAPESYNLLDPCPGCEMVLQSPGYSLGYRLTSQITRVP